MKSSFPHRPVLLSEILTAFENTHLNVFIDGTLGAGGHAEALLERHPEIDLYLGIDQDPGALTLAAERLHTWKHKLSLKQGNFAEFGKYLRELNISLINGAMIDLGVSSMQFDQGERGFSFSKEGPLDMRMDPHGKLTAGEIVNYWAEAELGRVFREYGEEKKWRLAAQAIVQAREVDFISTTTQLAALLKPFFPYNPRKGINPLTLIFQALRIAVNRELAVLDEFIPRVIERLAPKGRLAVISFHSLEDRIVKNHMRFAASDKWETSGLGGGLFRDKKPVAEIISRKPVSPSINEIESNPRSRSAKLRVLEKLEV
ncbi:MAG: 16S rRNA (cytosine(1402)-N(4))-methyltransferase RsmH [Candidatus Protochlamydia sp.]|nr:16S rRNA (cytosine(1402)-N(4))-methyltransferase RsmH [Candidatus Protochlamydia sp.]